MLSRRKRAEARVEVQQLSPILMIAQVGHMETALWWDPSVRVHNVTPLTKASKLDYPKKNKKKASKPPPYIYIYIYIWVNYKLYP